MLPPARHLNGRLRSVTVSCLVRWILKGVRTPNGPVKLEAVRMGGRWLTSAEALARFAEAQTPRLDGGPIDTRNVSRHQGRAERAGKELAKVGI